MFGKKNKTEQIIQNTVKDFFEKTSFEVDIKIGHREDNSLPVLIELEEPQALIGEGGKTLLSIQHLLNKIIRKEFKDESILYIDLDINDYKKKKNSFLKELARSSADEVALSGKEKELRPMPAYERRIIHLELKDRADIQTESIGQGLQRRVIVKLA